MSLNTTAPDNQPFDFEKENNYLKLTLEALRNKMDNLQIQQEEEIQKTKAGFKDEINQLQNTINALRSKIEKSQIKNLMQLILCT